MGTRPPARQELLPGTLDKLLLKTLSIGVMHGYAVPQHIRQVSRHVRLAAEGISGADADRLAAVRGGNAARVREESREVWGFRWIDALSQDVRYGLRQILGAPMFSAIAILSLAIGIGATTAVFSLADATLLEAIPGRHHAH